MKWAVIFLSGIVLGGTAIWVSTSYVLIPSVPLDISNSSAVGEAITYSDFISVLLTFVTIFLAIMAVMIGAVATYSIQSIKDAAKNQLQKAKDEFEVWSMKMKKQTIEETLKDIKETAFNYGTELEKTGELEEGFGDEIMEER